MKKPIQPWQITLIKVAQNDRGQSREDYLLLLADLFGSHIKSCTQLSFDQANQLIDDYKRKGFVVVSNKPRHVRTRSKGKNIINLANAGELAKIAALAALIPWQVEDGLSRFLTKRCQVRSGKVRTAAEAYHAIEGLKKYYTHLMAGIHGLEWWTIRFEDLEIERFISEHAPADYRDAVTGKVYKRAV
ncbi:MAG: phage protein GemA/Gp16 family protein [Desulfuromonadales bacterium]|nr:phage protein GemA/Gp16 family protein [Desulfuromonadales bacterium]